MAAIWRTLLGRWWIVLISVTACLFGGLVVVVISVPRYEGSARVVLEYIRPDPTTGSVLPSKMLDAYIASQIKLIRDIQVTGPAVEAMGWLDSPDVQESYAARDPRDTRDIQTWLAAQVSGSAGARMVEGSNIMEILYVGSSPELTEAVVDALRASYVQADVSAKRTAATAAADRLQVRLTMERAALVELERLQNRYEDETGLTMNASGRDEEGAKLEGFLRRDALPVLTRAGRTAATVSPTAMLLRQVDDEIARTSNSLGVNNPGLILLRQRRIGLQALLNTELSRTDSSAMTSEINQRALSDMIEAQKTRVLAVREPTLRLRLMQDEINQKRTSLGLMSESLAQNRQLAATTTSQVRTVGLAEAKPEPVFPNKQLILGGSAGLGLALGCLLAFFVELMGRRLRAATDLEMATGVPVLGTVPDVRRLKGPRRRRGVRPAPVVLAAE